MHKYFTLLFLLLNTLSPLKSSGAEQICLNKGAKEITAMCCVNTPEHTIIDQNSTACSCSDKWSAPKQLCQCPEVSLFIEGKCRTAEEVNQFEHYQQQVSLMKVPVYISFISDSSTSTLNNELVVDVDGAKQILDMSSIRFSYQVTLQGTLAITFYAPVFKQNNDFIKALFTNHIAPFNGLKISGCSFFNTDDKTNQGEESVNDYILASNILLKESLDSQIESYAIRDFKQVMSQHSDLSFTNAEHYVHCEL